jgi:predicted nucleic acid-binding Zn ribbon protein
MIEETRCPVCSKVMGNQNYYCSRKCFLSSGEEEKIKQHLEYIKRL